MTDLSTKRFLAGQLLGFAAAICKTWSPAAREAAERSREEKVGGIADRASDRADAMEGTDDFDKHSKLHASAAFLHEAAAKLHGEHTAEGKRHAELANQHREAAKQIKDSGKAHQASERADKLEGTPNKRRHAELHEQAAQLHERAAANYGKDNRAGQNHARLAKIHWEAVRQLRANS